MLSKNSHYSVQPLKGDRNYVPNNVTETAPVKNYFSLKLSDLEDLYMSDYLNSEYDENDWEEEEELDPNDIDDDLTEDYDENDREVDTFSEDGYKVD